MDEALLQDEEFFQPFTIKAIHIVNQEGMSNNISGIVSGFKLFESIERKFLTGYITILDGVNIQKYFRYTGQEFIRFSFGHGSEDEENPGPILDLTLRVYKMSNQIRHNETLQYYKLDVCDPALFIANTARFSQVFRGRYSDILYKVINQHLSIPNSEIKHWENTETENNQVVCPNWRGTQLIEYLVNNADKGTNSSWRNGMFFYQTMVHGYNFKSIDMMCSGENNDIEDRRKKNPVHKFFLKPTSHEGDSPSREQILKMSKPQVFDTLVGTVNGGFASHSKSYDSVRKLEKENIYDIEETMERGSFHVSKYPLIRTESMLESFYERALTTENPLDDEFPPVKDVPHQFRLPPNKQKNSMVLYDFDTNHDFDNSKDISSNEVFSGNKIKDNSKLERFGLKEVLNQNRIEIKIPIRTDISVGNIVELIIPESEVSDDQSITKDKINDNRYLIADMSLSANIQVGEGILTLECLKESYAQKIERSLLNRMIDTSTPPENVDLEEPTSTGNSAL